MSLLERQIVDYRLGGCSIYAAIMKNFFFHFSNNLVCFLIIWLGSIDILVLFILFAFFGGKKRKLKNRRLSQFSNALSSL